MSDYPGFPKIPRLNRDIIVTEKIDGSNSQIRIAVKDEDIPVGAESLDYVVNDGVGYMVYAGSRKRWISPGADNFGFAKWVQDNAKELVGVLGEGTHWGEWWGSGIQRGYGLRNGERYFSLFNTTRWSHLALFDEVVPGLRVVPELWRGNLKRFNQEQVLTALANIGSYAMPGFMSPEGIIVFHEASNHLYKVTLLADEQSKSEIVGKDQHHGNVLKSEPIDGTW